MYLSLWFLSSSIMSSYSSRTRRILFAFRFCIQAMAWYCQMLAQFVVIGQIPFILYLVYDSLALSFSLLVIGPPALSSVFPEMCSIMILECTEVDQKSSFCLSWAPKSSSGSSIPSSLLKCCPQFFQNVLHWLWRPHFGEGSKYRISNLLSSWGLQKSQEPHRRLICPKS